ncbi:hypothetical protein V8F20_006088 [Naviculisporaceae sp. PSN 640]
MVRKSTVFEDDEIQTLVILERTGGSLSLFSVVLIFIAYGMFDRLRTLPNTFIVFASVANMFASIASIIAYDGVALGQLSSLCQAQGFLFHLFVQSDPWWSLAMAVNVLLVFFKGANPHTIKRWGWLYCLICYGGPFVIAMICLFLREPNKTVVYGSAGLWCWVSNDWNELRIYTYYMLIWICILTSLFIYLGIGVYVFRARNKLKQLSGNGNMRGTFDHPALKEEKDDHDDQNRRSAVSTSEWPLKSESSGGQDTPNNNSALSPSSLYNGKITRPEKVHSLPFSPAPLRSPLPPKYQTPESREAFGPRPATHQTLSKSGVRRIIGRFAIEDPVKRAYLRTAVLFALSVVVTWIPSSINRIRGLIYPDSPYPYNVATAAVLPLQGLWNGVIFFVTSWKNLRISIREMMTPGKGVVELTDQPARTIKVTYDIWRDTEQGADGDNGLGLRMGAKRRDSWDFLYPRQDGADSRGIREVSSNIVAAKKGNA